MLPVTHASPPLARVRARALCADPGSFASTAAVEAAVALHGSRIAGMPLKPIRVTYAITPQDIAKAAFRKGGASLRKSFVGVRS